MSGRTILKPKDETKLSRVRPGVWRNRWRITRNGHEYVGLADYSSREDAEAFGNNPDIWPSTWVAHQFLGAEFFPEESNG